MSDFPRLKVLFLCTGNSCRSQMAEGWTRQLRGDVIEAHSAGVIAHGLNERAVAVMAEAGVDISGHRSQTMADMLDIPFDYVVTVCAHAAESCPAFPSGATVVHVSFDDPPSLTMGIVDEDEALDIYRRVRDEIRDFVSTLPASLMAADQPPQTRIV